MCTLVAPTFPTRQAVAALGWPAPATRAPLVIINLNKTKYHSGDRCPHHFTFRFRENLKRARASAVINFLSYKNKTFLLFAVVWARCGTGTRGDRLGCNTGWEYEPPPQPKPSRRATPGELENRWARAAWWAVCGGSGRRGVILKYRTPLTTRSLYVNIIARATLVPGPAGQFQVAELALTPRDAVRIRGERSFPGALNSPTRSATMPAGARGAPQANNRVSY
ncbi:hypothetical protein EVAR_68544_1 [Eumeta japonica]|uniref:Uncharacterized protein n=1 Tax=Eumeta variegata TaxID=151549 RepID=A0A4C1ZX82_EUMVA|nr:hypothetical protein EVAR_68544_1 [Eumeta japonica]